ncbi:hypothetical protein [Mycobacterium sp.]|uniref:hypothetical protein n=1 Tax=Mycobacterium sp. TaxID=1785 RepID=UPI002D869A6D|nr:hypothetical protein [Mycobacterium sp.]
MTQDSRAITYEVRSVRFAPSDPPDGNYYTAIARCVVSDHLGRVEAFGYASDVEPNQEVVDRAISEGVERAIVVLLHQSDTAANEKTTTGSAVHKTPEQALAGARRELFASFEFVTRFHKRDMGFRLPEVPFAFTPRSAEVTGWIDPAQKLVFAAMLDPDATPRLSMTVRSATGVGWSRALELSVLEILQPRPWIRHTVARFGDGQGRTEVRSAEERAVYWSTIDSEIASGVYRELVTAAAMSTPEDRETSTEAVIGDDSLTKVVTRLALDGDHGPLHFARVVDPVIDGRYVTSELEREKFWRDGATTFHPHPLI